MNVISLFSGAGGLDIGFEQAGFDIIIAIEADPACCNTLRKNKPQLKVIEKDIAQTTGEEILQAVGLKRSEVDIIIGGPPCQSFSLAGKRMGLNDKRGSMVLEFARLIHEILPKCFLMENVKGMLNWEKGKAIEVILNTLKEPIIYKNKKYIYNTDYSVLNSVDYGAPQKRERLFIVGNRLGKGFIFPKATHGNSIQLDIDSMLPYNTTWDAIGNLPKADQPSETAKRVSKTIKARIVKYGY